MDDLTGPTKSPTVILPSGSWNKSLLSTLQYSCMTAKERKPKRQESGEKVDHKICK